MPEIRQGVGARQEARDSSPSRPAPDPMIGRVINKRFRIINLIARGGMGKVYRAEQAPLGRICAVKILNPNYDGDSDPEFHRRFFLEAATAAKLTHPNTVTVFDYGKSEEDDDIYYIAMEYIEGKTLHRILRECGPFSEARTAHVARQVCRSLREAHSLGVVHRDLKPANILLVDHGDEADNVKVLDFGLVKDVSGRATEDLTQAGLFMGSPKYMAPEQIVGSGISAATDIYSLGVMLYEMLSGKVPFDKGKSVVTLMAHVNEPPPPMSSFNPNISISAGMESIVARCLEKDPTKRYASMNDLLLALKRAGGGDWMTDTNEALPAAISVSGPRALPIDTATPLEGVPNASVLSPSVPPSTGAHAVHTVSSPMFASPSISETLGPSQTLTTGRSPGEPQKSNWKGYFGVGLAVSVVAGVAFVAFGSGTEAPTKDVGAESQTTAPTSALTTAIVAAPTTSAVVAPPPVPERVVHIESEPSGASVSEGGKELCDATPCDVKWEGDDATSTTTRKLVLSKAGYQNESVKLASDDAKVSAKLSVIVVAPRPRPQPAAGTAKPADKPGDYKPSPY